MSNNDVVLWTTLVWGSLTASACLRSWDNVVGFGGAACVVVVLTAVGMVVVVGMAVAHPVLVVVLPARA
jgi:hypothetical protein